MILWVVLIECVGYSLRLKKFHECMSRQVFDLLGLARHLLSWVLYAIVVR